MDHATRRARLLLVATAVVAVIALAFALVACTRGPRPAPTAAPTISIQPAPTWSSTVPALPDDVHVTWAYLDSTDGTHTRSGDTDLHELDRLIVPGLAQVYTDPPAELIASALAQNEQAGAELIEQAGGPAAFRKVIDVCALDDAEPDPPRATALAVAQYAACLREGAITDPDRAGKMLDSMRTTAGGIGDVRGNDGGQRLAQFNSTAPAGTGRHRTWCMGIGAYWSAAVLVDWPTGRGALYGVAACAEVARTGFPPDTQPAPESNPPAPAPST